MEQVRLHVLAEIIVTSEFFIPIIAAMVVNKLSCFYTSYRVEDVDFLISEAQELQLRVKIIH